jgi:inorganic pyrophosphatase
MQSASFLETLPLSGIAKYAGGRPKDALPFAGYPRQHPSEKNKLILVYDPLGPNPVALEFRLEDVLFVEEIPQAVTVAGEGVPLVKLWIRRGAHGVILEPFEVQEPVLFANKARDLRERFLENRSRAGV